LKVMFSHGFWVKTARPAPPAPPGPSRRPFPRGKAAPCRATARRDLRGLQGLWRQARCWDPADPRWLRKAPYMMDICDVFLRYKKT
jgi:hypothetical protein